MGKLVRMGALAQLLHLFIFVSNPVLNEIIGEHIPLFEKVIVLLQSFQGLLERSRDS